MLLMRFRSSHRIGHVRLSSSLRCHVAQVVSLPALGWWIPGGLTWLLGMTTSREWLVGRVG